MTVLSCLMLWACESGATPTSVQPVSLKPPTAPTQTQIAPKMNAQGTHQELSPEELKAQAILDAAVIKRRKDDYSNAWLAHSHYRIALNMYNDYHLSDVQGQHRHLVKARSQLITAITYDPTHQPSRKLYTKVSSLLGMPDSRARDIAENAGARRDATQQQYSKEVELMIENAETLMTQGNYEKALEVLAKVNQKISE